MKCISCETEIPPSWRAAISNNICPACGGPICNEAMKELMDSLADALSRMPNDAQGVAGWLLSNYQLTKIGTGEPVNEFYGSKPKQAEEKSVEDELRNNPKIRENLLEKFYKRANLNAPKDYKALKEKIEHLSDDEDDMDNVTLDSEDFVEEALDPEFTQKVLSTMSQPVSKKDIKRFKQVDQEFDQDEKIHPALQYDRMERLKKQKDVSYGAKVGVIRRDT